MSRGPRRAAASTGSGRSHSSVEAGGLAVVGDEVTISGRHLGTLAGYDMTHMPNHMGVLMKALSVDEPEMRVGGRVIIRRP
jgi:hypothetical protein